MRVKKNKKLILYTYQSKEAVKRLQQVGVLKLYKKDRKFTHLTRYDGEQYNYFEYPYKYMIHEMKKRLPPPSDSKVYYPIWAWYKSAGRYKPQKKMDKIHKGLVRLKLEIDESRVLLSDFDAFAAVISGTRILKEEESETIDFDADKKFDPSLQEMFTLHRKEDTYFSFSIRSETIQATFWELYLSDVVEIMEND